MRGLTAFLLFLVPATSLAAPLPRVRSGPFHPIATRQALPERLTPARGVESVCGSRIEAAPDVIREHLARVIDGEIVWAPAIDGAFLLSARGGDFELRLGQDLSIGYLAHDVDTVQLYFQESLTFLVYTAEASVALTAGGAA